MHIYWDTNGEHLDPYLEMLNSVAATAAKYCEAPQNSELSISFVDVETIRQLNADYRGKDVETDVLSFPVSNELAMGDDFSLGDIAVCMEVAEAQAQEYGHSTEREIAFLVVHGILHLMGYDHESPEDEAEMKKAQEEILLAHGLAR